MKNLKITFCSVMTLSLATQVSPAKNLNEYLAEGDLANGIIEFTQSVSGDEFTDEEVFSLGVLQFFKGVENLAQSFYTYGLDRNSGRRANLPFLRLPVPPNPNPEPVTLSDISELLEQFHSDMETANHTLGLARDRDFTVPVNIATIRLDLNKNGQLEDDEYFHEMYLVYNQRARALFQEGKPFIVNFDAGDACWLKGYTHLLMAMTDVLLAHDETKVFEYTAHVFFPNVDTVLGEQLGNQEGNESFALWADLIAGIHVMNMEVIHPERLISAHEHLLKTIDCSRKSWELIEKETDNSREWIPNSKQTSVNGVQITGEMIAAWKEFLSEFEAILNGDKLVPHWRFHDGRGINLKKVFYEPRPFDLVLWIQGTSAIPYLEEGLLSRPDTWGRITGVFQGNFIGFSIWVN